MVLYAETDGSSPKSSRRTLWRASAATTSTTRTILAAAFTLVMMAHCDVVYAQQQHNVECRIGQMVCECADWADQCVFTLEVEELFTFASYKKIRSVAEDGSQTIQSRGRQGVSYYIDDNGRFVPINSDGGTVNNTRTCFIPLESDRTFQTSDCTEPIVADGKTFRPVVVVNGVLPGPTLIVHHGQDVLAHVRNKLFGIRG